MDCIKFDEWFKNNFIEIKKHMILAAQFDHLNKLRIRYLEEGSGLVMMTRSRLLLFRLKDTE